MIKQLINIIGGFTLRIVLRLFYIFKINHKRVLFVAYEGRQYSCNPKYIFEYLYNSYKKDYELVWCLNDRDSLPKQFENVKIVKHYSLLYFYYALTSKYFISNLAIDPILPKREKQVFDLLVSNKSTEQIAEKLGISEKTVRNHISNVMQKLGVKGRAGAVIELLKLKEISL